MWRRLSPVRWEATAVVVLGHQRQLLLAELPAVAVHLQHRLLDLFDGDAGDEVISGSAGERIPFQLHSGIRFAKHPADGGAVFYDD